MAKEPRLIQIPVAGFKASVRFYEGVSKSCPTLLALHGFTGSGKDFLPLRDSLGRDQYHWACIDFMGHGLSDSPPTLDPYILPNALALIDAVRQLAPDPQKVCLIAYSMGGRVAMHYLKWAKPLPTALISTSPGIDDPVERAQRRFDDASWIVPEMIRIDEFCERWEKQPLIHPQTLLPKPLVTALAVRRRSNNLIGLRHSLLALGAGVLPSLWNDLSKLPPALCLFGHQDDKFRRIAQLMEAENPGLKATAVAGCGHSPHLEAPESIAPLLVNFLLSR